MIELDGAEGEGGGQVLRTALTLAMIAQVPFRMHNIRAGRAKPGLLRQHLTAVQAATEISAADTIGAQVSSRELSFSPGPVRAGDFRYAIGTAGSCTLVLQTVLPALWFANGSSRVRVTGGTHNPAAPPVDFVQGAWLPLLARMGVTMTVELLRCGFYPAGGGEVCASVEPSVLRPLQLETRGEFTAAHMMALVAGVPRHVAEREVQRVCEAFTAATSTIRELPQREGPGNAVALTLAYEHVTEVFCGFGERGRSAEGVADGVTRDARAYVESGAAIGSYLADQMLLPMALAGGGSFTTMQPTSHSLTNISVIEQFLPVKFVVKQVEGARGLWQMGVTERGAESKGDA